LISFSANALAQESQGRYSQVLEGTPVPFNGWCFDDQATAEIFSKLKHAEESCNLKTKNKLDKQKVEFTLKIDNLNLRISTLQQKHDELLAVKDTEIEKLEQAALKRPNDYTIWWATGSFTAGVLTVVTIFLVTK
jgi:hypothetical protein